MTRTQVANELRNNSKFLILTHVNPDGDTIGSALALSSSLKLAGKETIVCGIKPIPHVFDFLPKFSEIINTTDEFVNSKIKEEFTIIFVDFNHLSRAGLSSIPDSSNVIIIDHHPGETYPTNKSIIETETASNAEIIYHILKVGNFPITVGIGNAIMAGILTDTGSFHYPNVTNETMKTTTELIELGVNISYVSEMVYERATLANRKLLGVAMSRLKLSKDKIFSNTYILHQDIIKHNAKKNDLDFIIDEVRKLAGIEVYIFGKEYTPGEFRVSMRGRGKIDIRKVANSFDGGGHRNAAGFTFKGSWDDIIKLVEDKLMIELQASNE